MLDIGGGFPVRHVKPIPSIEVIGEVVNEALEGVSGRGAGDRRAGPLPRVRRRLFRLPRDRHDDARRQALDALGRGPVRRRDRDRPKASSTRSAPTAPGRTCPGTSAGPTCDSVDVVLRDEPLPSDLQEGDFIYIRNAGAYTTAYASEFNGFPLPEVRVFESPQ